MGREKYSPAVWEAVRARFESTDISIRGLHDAFGPSESMIRKKIAAEGWERGDIEREVQAATKRKQAEAKAPAGASKAEIIEAVAQSNLETCNRHMETLARLEGFEGELAARLDSLLNTVNVQAAIETGDQDEIDRTAKRLSEVMGSMSLVYGRLVQAASRRIHMERQILNLVGKDPDEEDDTYTLIWKGAD